MSAADLDVIFKDEDGIIFVSLVGPVDSATFDDFKTGMQPLLREPKPHVVVDCSRLTYINSKGIGLLANLHRQSLISLGYAAFYGIAPRIRKTFDLLGLGKRLRMFDTAEEAVAACKGHIANG